MDGMHYALGCNGSGVAMMTYLGHQTARRIVGGANATCGFELEEFPDFPLYNGSPNWALPGDRCLLSFPRRLKSCGGALRLTFRQVGAGPSRPPTPADSATADAPSPPARSGGPEGPGGIRARLRWA